MPATMEPPPTPTPSLASTASQASLTPARLTSTPSRKHLRSSPSNPYSSAYGSPRPVVPTNKSTTSSSSTAPSASTSTRPVDSGRSSPAPLSLRPNTFGRRAGKNSSSSHVGQAGPALAAGNGHTRPIGKLASPSKPSNAVTPTHVTTHVITQSVTHPHSPNASASTSTSSTSTSLPATAKTSNAPSLSVSGIPTPSVRQRVDALTRANGGSASTSAASISGAGVANSTGTAPHGNAPSLRGVSSVPNINSSKSSTNATTATNTTPTATMQAPATKSTAKETLAAPSLRPVSSVPNINQSKATMIPTRTMKQANMNEAAAKEATKEALTTQPNNIPNPTLMAPPPPAPAAAPSPTPVRTPARPPAKDIQHRVSRSVGCLPVPSSPRASPFGSGKILESPKLLDEPLLLPDPNLWSTSELAQHLAWALRTGGNDGSGPTLPAVVVEDVVSWVLRQRVTGRKFLRGVTETSGSRPPPFLPVLAAMSKRLRRQYRDGDTASDISDVTEESEYSPDAVSRVKRLAHAFDSISSASEVSGDEDLGLSALRAQVAPETSHGFGRATPKKEAHGWRRRDSAASVSSIASLASGVSDASIGSSVPRWRQRCLSNASDASLWNAPAPLADSPTAKLSKGKADPDPMASPDAATAAIETSPPPPYVPTAPASPMRTGLLFPDPSTPDGSRSSSVTPLHTEARNTPAPELSPVHLMRMGAHRDSGVDPYAVLRHDGRPRRPGMPFNENAHDADNDSDSDSDGNRPHWTTTRRVTARPRGLSPSKKNRDAAANSLVPPAHTPGSRHSTPSSRRHERELEREVTALVDRIRELESRLAAVETDKDRSPSEEAPSPEVTQTQVELDSPATPELKEEDEDDVVELVSPTAARLSSPKSPVSPLRIVPVYATEMTQSLDSDSDPTTPTASCPTPSPGSAHRSLSQSVELDLDLEGIDEDNDTSSDANNSKALVPYSGGRRRSWLALIGLVGPDGAEPRLYEIPSVVFLMGIGVGVGFSAVVIRTLMGKKM